MQGDYCQGFCFSCFFFSLNETQSMWRSSAAATRPPDLFSSSYHLFKLASHLLLHFTCSAKTSSTSNRVSFFFLVNIYSKQIWTQIYIERACLLTEKDNEFKEGKGRGRNSANVGGGGCWWMWWCNKFLGKLVVLKLGKSCSNYTWWK